MVNKYSYVASDKISYIKLLYTRWIELFCREGGSEKNWLERN